MLITGSQGMAGSYIDFGIKTNRRSLDVTDLKEAFAVCKKYQPDAIVHLAAETDVDRCERDPEYAYMVNSIGTYNMATIAKQLGIKLVYVSTAGVFDGKKESPYTESDIPNPQNYYGRSKFLGELAVSGVLEDFLLVRVCWMFGGGPTKDQKFVAKIIAQLDSPEIKVVTDQIGSPTFCKDVIRGIKILLNEDARGVFNLSNEGVISRYEFAKEIVNILQRNTIVTPVSMNDFKMDAYRTFNEGMIASRQLSRPWKDALKEYLTTEWKEQIKQKQ